MRGRNVTGKRMPIVENASSRHKKTELQEALALVAGHAPDGWQEEFSASSLRKHLDAGSPVNMIVLAADIKRSTFLMKEAVDFRDFARIIGGFVEAAAALVKSEHGWFDKFTGDGFLAYWLYGDLELGPYVSRLFRVCHSMLYHFQQEVMDDLRRNSRNFPAGVGLVVGIDAGPGHLVTVAGDLTVVGSPVVGAVRMASAAGVPWETLSNVYLGEVLYRNRAALSREDVDIAKEMRCTKEYEQEVYRLVFRKSYGVAQEGVG